MDGKNIAVAALAAVLGVLATMTLNQASSSTSGSSTSDQSADAKTSAPDSKATKKPSANSPATGEEPGADDPNGPIHAIEAAFPNAFSPPHSGGGVLDVPVRVLLATLPSPTGALAIDFDRGLEAIERAAQSQRYVVQSAWTPWDKSDGGGKPGWFLFRRDGKKSNELLVVLLACEHPASGVSQTELEGAFKDFKDIAQRSSAPAAYNVLPLLGPYYSGSAVSIEQGMRAICASSKECAERELFVISGSATRRQTQVIFQRLNGVFAKSDFYATVLPDDLLQLGMQRFIKERLQGNLDDIAELTESSTDYGNAIASATTTAQKLETATSAQEKGVKIPVPIGLGMLTGDVDPAGNPRRFDRTSAKVTLELQHTFATLARNGVQHVGILTTTTDDQIMLATQFRDVAPNLRLHLYESSIDLADRRRNKRALDGVMVASSYPLFPATQLWNDSANGSLVEFPSMAAEGIYNAVLVLLSRSDKDLGDSLANRLRDYLSPFCALIGPSAWVSVSIAGQLWPLAVYPPNRFTRVEDPLCDQPTTDPYVYLPNGGALEETLRPRPRAGVNFLTVLGTTLVLLLIVATIVSFLPFARRSYWRLPLVTYDSTAKDGELDWALPGTGAAHRISTIGIIALAITGLVMGKVMSLPGWFQHASQVPSYSQRLGTLLQFTAILLVGLTWLIGSFRADVERPGAHVPLWRRSHTFLGLIFLLMALALYVFPRRGLTRQPDGHTYFFYLRSVDPSVGLTPTIPIFLVGMTAYVAALLMLLIDRRSRRLTNLATAWAKSPDGASAKHSFNSCATAMTKFARKASSSLIPPVAFGAAFGTVILFWSPLRLGSLEGREFDLACSLCFSFAFSLTLATAWRANLLWYRLREFTHALGTHPAAKALERLPKPIASRFRSPVPGEVGHHAIDVALVMKAHALGLSEVPKVSELREALEPYWFPSHAPAPRGALRVPPALQPHKSQEGARETLEEDILALEMADILGIMCDSTRTMLFIATGSGLVALLASALYPFQPAATLTGAALVTVGLVAVVALRLLLGIERDEVLSSAADTTPGKITPSLGLMTRLVGYVVVPVAGLVAARLPHTATVLDVFKNIGISLGGGGR
jgi:hypothetical protein